MNKEKVFLIDDNIIECIYNDNFNLNEMGNITIGRASNVEFNNHKKKWEVIVNEKAIHENDNRESAIEWEIEYFQNKLRDGQKISNS